MSEVDDLLRSVTEPASSLTVRPIHPDGHGGGFYAP
jgi:hypothetical protein